MADLEVGIRGENWVKALRYFKDSPLMTDERAEKIECCLREHGGSTSTDAFALPLYQ